MKHPFRLAAAALSLSLGAAAEERPPAAVPAFDLERLELDPSATGALLVGNGRTLAPRAYRLTLLGQHQRDPLELQVDEASAGSVVRSRTSAHLAFAYGVNTRLEVGALLSAVLSQAGDDLTEYGVAPVARSGVATPVAYARYGLLSVERSAPLDLSLSVAVGLPVGSGSALAAGGFMVAPRVLAGKQWGAYGLAAEMGARFTPAVRLEGDEVGSGLTAAVAGTRSWGRYQAELGTRVQSFLTDLPAGAEAFVAGRVRRVGPLELVAILGRGFGTAPGVPSWRALLGVALAPAASVRPAALAPLASRGPVDVTREEVAP